MVTNAATMSSSFVHMQASHERGMGLNGVLADVNVKTREDHRYHAIDAFVMALMGGRSYA